MRTRQALVQHEIGEGRFLALEERADVARGYAVTRGKGIDGEPTRGDVGHGVRLDRPQPGNPHAASPGDLGGFARRAEGKSDEIVDMVGGSLLQAGR